MFGDPKKLFPGLKKTKSIKNFSPALVPPLLPPGGAPRVDMALDLLRSAKGILKTDELTIDNVVFKLHYRVTVAILIGSSLIGVAKQYFGDPINCQV